MSSLVTVCSNSEAFSRLQQNAVTMIEENYNWRKVIQQFNQELYATK
jgi:hypothetical protein